MKNLLENGTMDGKVGAHREVYSWSLSVAEPADW